MDRTIVYPGSIPLDTDILSTNRNVMVALGALTAATVGNGPTVDGLAVQPAPGGGLSVVVSPGSFIANGPLDQSGYGTLPADASDSLVKMGVNVAAVTVALAAPTGSGTVITYLIQATFQELDVNLVVLPYYNAANPSQPFMGAANNGLAQPTLRTQRVAIQAKAGAAGTPGANQVPTPDPGWVGLATVTIANGQINVISANIVPSIQTQIISYKLGNLRPGTAQWSVFTSSGSFVVPSGVTRLHVMVLGGGASAGTHATLPGGGGGAGGTSRGWVYTATPGTTIPITVGLGGAAPVSPANGNGGGTSSFGTFMSATGGQPGLGGTLNQVMAGGQGGTGVGGDYQASGSCGTDAIPLAARGGDGGGPGNGRGTSGFVPGWPGLAPGAGGGGGGSSMPAGTGVGAQGGSGANGIVIVEY